MVETHIPHDRLEAPQGVMIQLCVFVWVLFVRDVWVRCGTVADALHVPLLLSLTTGVVCATKLPTREPEMQPLLGERGGGRDHFRSRWLHAISGALVPVMAGCFLYSLAIYPRMVRYTCAVLLGWLAILPTALSVPRRCAFALVRPCALFEAGFALLLVVVWPLVVELTGHKSREFGAPRRTELRVRFSFVLEVLVVYTPFLRAWYRSWQHLDARCNCAALQTDAVAADINSRLRNQDLSSIVGCFLHPRCCSRTCRVHRARTV